MYSFPALETNLPAIIEDDEQTALAAAHDRVPSVISMSHGWID